MSTLIQDLRYAGRRMARQPGLTSIVVISLALGIGANTMVFSLTNGLFLSSLPYSEPDRVAMIWFSPANRPDQRAAATYMNCAALRQRPTQSFERIGCMVGGTATNLSEDGENAAAAERLFGQEYTADLAQVLGVEPVVGRWFTAEENERGRGPVMLISHRLWQRRFGASPDVLGKKVRVTFTQSAGHDMATIVGVVPAGFDFFNPQADYWFAFVLPAGAENSPSRRYMVAGRLKPGVTLAQAQAEMDGIAAGFAEEFPRTNKNWNIRLQPVKEAYLGQLRNPLLTLQGAVAFVLLIACANVAGLLLAQGAAQHKELAIRSALGSGRGRMVRELLTGHVALAVVGGVAGLAVAWAGMRILISSLPVGFPRMDQMAIDTTVLAFTVGLSVLTGLTFGILPALQVTRPDLMDTLRDSTRSVTAGKAHHRLRSGFVVLQIALALVLLIGAGLMINSLSRLWSVEPGFDTRNLMTFQTQFTGDRFIRDTGQATPTGSPETEITDLLFQTSDRIRERLATVPGVQSAMMETANIPLSGFAVRLPLSVPGALPASAEQEALSAEWYGVSPRYFDTLKVQVLRGREFAETDRRGALPVAIVNSTLARRLWADEDPIGRQIQVGFLNDPPRQIVGVVSDVRQSSRQEEPQPQMYIPFVQLPQFAQKQQSYGLETLTFVVRTAGNPEQLASALQAAVTDVDRNQPVANMRTVEWYQSNQLQGFRQYVLMLGVFGAIALVLAVVGIYGVMAHSVTQRTGEIGIRMALGATGSQVLRLVLRQGLAVIVIGLVLGFAASLALTRVIGSLLWGVTATDPSTFVAVLGVLALVSTLACYVPARRAVKVNPVVALRYE
jgi:putative ABC transport system permease protein